MNSILKNHSRNHSTSGIKESIYKTLYESYRPYFSKVVAVVALGFVGRLVLMSNAQFLAWFLDTHTQASQTVDTLIPASVLRELILNLFFLLSIAFVCTLLYRTFFSRYSSLAVSRIYDQTTYCVSRFPMSFFDKTPVGKITTRFSSDYGNVFRLFGGPLAEFLSILFDLVSIIIIMVYINPLFILSLSVAGVLFFFILKINQTNLRILRRDLSILRAPSVAHFSETVQGSVSIRQNHKMGIFQKRFFRLDNLFIDCKKSVIKNIVKFSTQLNVLSSLLFFTHGYICYLLLQKGIIGTGQITVILGFTVLATNTLQMFFEWYSQFDEALIGVERLDEYLHAPLEEGARLPVEADFSSEHPKKTLVEKMMSSERSPQALAIQVQDLYFRYETQTELSSKLSSEANSARNSDVKDEDILHDISFSLKPGQKLGIIGRTGAGKSSLISALLRLYPIRSGAIWIHNQRIDDVEEHRKQFSVITQDQFFIRGSLRNNLDLFGLYPDEKLKLLLEKVRLEIPLTFQVEEKGLNLSQGEKQLISLVRGLLQDTDIFIFDEATSNVDPQSEKLMQAALQSVLKDKTQIRIAHRLQTVQDCDLVLWLDHGRVKKLGPTKEVLEAFENSR